jgi:hypothetical protein
MVKRSAPARARAAKSAADRALAVVKTIAKVNRPGLNRSTARRVQRATSNPTARNMLRMSARPAAQYAASLLNNRVISSPAVPCTTARPFREVKCIWTCRPNMDDAGARAVLVINPHMLFTDLLTMATSITSATGAVATQVILPPVYNPIQAGTCAPGFLLVNAFPNGGVVLGGPCVGEKVIVNSQTTNTSLLGEVRFMGANVTFKTFETTLNTGGEVIFVHNPQERALVGVQGNAPGTTLDAGYQFQGAVPAVIEAVRSIASSDPVTGFTKEFVILPHTTEFHQVRTGFGPTAILGAETAQLLSLQQGEFAEEVAKVFPSGVGTQNPLSYTHAIIYKPAAAKAALATANCEVTIEAHFHTNLEFEDGTNQPNLWPMSAASAVNTPGVSDARSAAAIQSTIDAIKQVRIDDPAVVAQSIDKPNTLIAHAPSILSVIAKAAPDIAAGIGDLMPEGKFKNSFKLASTVGLNLFNTVASAARAA